MKEKVSVIGLGKAGLPLAGVIARAGIRVVGVDLDRNRVKDINSGKNPIPEEPGLAEIIKQHGGKGLLATTDSQKAAKECTSHIVIVPLFIDENKKPDFSILDSAFKSLAKGLKKGDLVVLETTVPPKTTETRIKDILEKGSKLKAGEDFHLAYSPERIMTGYSISRFSEFPKIIGGLTEKCTEKAFALYKKFANPIKVRNARTAELAKVAEGLYRDVNIALANELLMVAEHHGVDLWEVRNAANHQFCHIHEPGNVGGHCIPVYPWFIINSMPAPLLTQARSINDGMVEFYANKVDTIAKKKKGAKVGVIGLSYREGVKEKAYTRSIPLIEFLKKRGYDVYGLDPLYSGEEIAREFGAKPIKDIKKDLKVMDAIVLMNRNKEYMNDLLPLRGRVVDVKNVLGER